MNDKEKIVYYLDLLKQWEECLSAFFETECPNAPQGSVRVLLKGHSDITEILSCIVDNLPDAQEK